MSDTRRTFKRGLGYQSDPAAGSASAGPAPAPTGCGIVMCEWCDEPIALANVATATVADADDEGYLTTYNCLCPACHAAWVDQGIAL